MVKLILELDLLKLNQYSNERINPSEGKLLCYTANFTITSCWLLKPILFGFLELFFWCYFLVSTQCHLVTVNLLLLTYAGYWINNLLVLCLKLGGNEWISNRFCNIWEKTFISLYFFILHHILFNKSSRVVPLLK